jgi:hypothetical protein
MTHLRDLPPFPLLQFYATAPYGCSYLPGRIARSQVATPTHLIDSATYSELVRAGFRRSGVFTYRPYCDACRECQPVRLDVRLRAQPQPAPRSGAARRAHRARMQPELPRGALPALPALPGGAPFGRRHGPGQPRPVRPLPAADPCRQPADRVPRRRRAARRQHHRRAGRRLSSVYTFYDPDIPDASYGTFAILWQIAQCQHMGLPWLYLGYWIRDSRKMAYKARFRPLQALRHGEWQAVDG